VDVELVSQLAIQRDRTDGSTPLHLAVSSPSACGTSTLLPSCCSSLVVAFALAFYMVLAPVARTVAITVCVIVLPSLLCSMGTGKLGRSYISSTLDTIAIRSKSLRAAVS
jgi:hypothetical protein